ncbi:MAG: hypothetical protein JXR18_14565 [Neptuniibacter sp.]
MIKDVYFVDSRALSEKLHRGEISDEVAFKHLLIFSMLFASYIAIPVVVTCSESEAFTWWYQLVGFAVYAAITFWGMNLLYQTNKKGDGKEFFVRCAALSLPVGVQMWVIGIVLGAIYGGLVGFAIADWCAGAPDYVWLLAGHVLGALIQFIYFKLMQKNLTICSSGPQQGVK